MQRRQRLRARWREIADLFKQGAKLIEARVRDHVAAVEVPIRASADRD
jgi:hypothetical protein